MKLTFNKNKILADTLLSSVYVAIVLVHMYFRIKLAMQNKTYMLPEIEERLL